MSNYDYKFYEEEYTYKLANKLLELNKLAAKEVYSNKEDTFLLDNLDIDIQCFIDLYKSGFFKVFTIRKDNEIVGYICCTIIEHIQSKKNKICSVDSIFIKKEHRNFKLFNDFLFFFEEEMKSHKVKMIRFGVNGKNKTDLIFKRKGYKEDEIILTKIL